MEKAKQIINILKDVCEQSGLPVEIDRKYPVTTDSQVEGAPNDMPLIVIRKGQKVLHEPNWKNWDLRWSFSPKVIFFLQNKEDPESLSDYADDLFLDFVDRLKASDLQDVIMSRTTPDIAMEHQPYPGRPDVHVVAVTLEMVIER